MFKRLLIIVLPLPIAIGLALVMAQTVPQYRAYEIRMVTTMTSKGRNPAEGAPTVSRIWFGRTDGSRGGRTAEVINGRSCTSTAYWDIKSGLKVTSSECLGLKSTEPFVELPKIPGRPVATCEPYMTKDSMIGSETIQGLRVEKFRESNAAVESTVYHAPELGCLKVRGVFYWKNAAGEITGTTFDEPVEIKLGSPDPKLFETPATYREVLPSERRNKLGQFFSGAAEPAACLRKSNEWQDTKYLAARKRDPAWRVVASLQERSKNAVAAIRGGQQQSKPGEKTAAR